LAARVRRHDPQSLVEALGIGKGSLYNAVGSKHALFERALHRYRDSQVQALIEMLDEPGPVKHRLRRALRFLTEIDLADPDRRGCLAVNAAAEVAGTDEVATELVRCMFDRTEEAFRALVKETQRKGEIDSGRCARSRESAAEYGCRPSTVVPARRRA